MTASGVDLTAESIARVQARLTLRDLPCKELRQGSVLDLPFADDTFDMVFSHGVLHHVPDIVKPPGIHRLHAVRVQRRPSRSRRADRCCQRR